MLFSRWRLRRAALAMAAHDWPVAPGACLRNGRFYCRDAGCRTVSCHPLLDQWEQRASAEVGRIAQWWRYAPHSLLLPTGFRFDVLEVAAPLGALVVASRHWRGTNRGPVAAAPTGRWMFLVQSGHPLCPELAGDFSMVRHTRGSWVPAPPTRLAEGPVRWRVPPAEVAWRLPAADAVQQLLAGVLGHRQPRWGGWTSSTTTASSHT